MMSLFPNSTRLINPSPQCQPIYIWDACGPLGYSVPWAEWKDLNIVPCTTPRFELRLPGCWYITLYWSFWALSRGIEDPAEHWLTPEGHEAMKKDPLCIDLTGYMDQPDGKVLWDSVLGEIIKRADKKYKETA